MTNDGLERAIGRLEGKMDGMADEIKTVHIKVDRIATEGCTKGNANEKRIGVVEGTLKKAILVGLIISGGGAGTVKILDMLF